MTQTLEEFMKNKGITPLRAIPKISMPEIPSGEVGIKEVLKEVPTATGKTLRWIGKQLMKPVGVVATGAEQIGKAIGERRVEPLKEIPRLAGEVITGKRERSFTDIWRENLPEHPTAATMIGLATDIAADPLNFIGGIATKGLTALEKIAPKIPLYKGAKTLFSTKTESKVFDAFIDEMKSLEEYRKAKILEGARDIQKAVSKLPKDDVIKVSNYIEKGTKSTPEINKLGELLKSTYKEWKTIEKEMAIKGGEIAQYVPHIKARETLAQSIKKTIFPARQWTTKLGGAEKGRQILKFVADDGTELIGKAENLGLKETTKGFRDITGKIFQPQQASIDEIAQAFGKHFFEENPAIQMAYRGLAHAKAVTSKEFFNGVKQFATKTGIETAVPELKGLKFADDIAKQIDNYYQAIKPEELKLVVRTYDGVLNWWKAQALIAPSYHMRNFVSNLWNNFLAGVKNPISYIQAGMLQFGKARDFRIAGMTGEELLNLAQKRGVLGKGWYAADIPTAIESGLTATWRKGLNPLSQQNYAFRLNRAIGTALENNARLAHFIEKLKIGSSVNDAVLSVKKFLFDYQDLTNFEKNVLKRFFPFYTWTRKNIPLQLENLIKQPGKYAGLEKVIRGIENITMGDTRPANEKYLSDYIKHNSAMRIKYNEQDKTYYYFLLGEWMPSYQAIDFLSRPMAEIMGMLTPILKTPMEIYSNKSTFFRNTLGELQVIEQYPGDNTMYLGFSMPKKVAYVLRNIRLLNELDKFNPGDIFGGKKGEPSIFKGLPILRTPIGVISPAPYKYGKLAPIPTIGERIAGLFFGKLTPYKEAQSREFYQRETEKRKNELIRAIKDASREGDRERVKLLQQQLREFLRERGR